MSQLNYHHIFRAKDIIVFGILTPPVEKILEVKRGSDDITRYLNYLSNLNEIKKEFGFHRIADVDMALYVYALLGLPQIKIWAPKDCLDIIKYHESNPSIIKQIRARNLFSEIWNQDNLHMANLLYEIDFQTAGLLYGINLEAKLKRLSDSNKLTTSKIDNGILEYKDFRTLVNELRAMNILDHKETNDLHNAWHIRCSCIHGNQVTKMQVRDLQDAIRLIVLKIKKK